MPPPHLLLLSSPLVLPMLLLLPTSLWVGSWRNFESIAPEKVNEFCIPEGILHPWGAKFCSHCPEFFTPGVEFSTPGVENSTHAVLSSVHKFHKCHRRSNWKVQGNGFSLCRATVSVSHQPDVQPECTARMYCGLCHRCVTSPWFKNGEFS